MENQNTSDYQDIYLIPAVFINKELIKENIDLNVVLSAMCVKLNKKIDICKSFVEKVSWNKREPGEILGNLFMFGLLIIISTCLIIGILIIIKIYVNGKIKFEMKESIEKHVNDYMRIKDIEVRN